jgi:hypothetical protein
MREAFAAPAHADAAYGHDAQHWPVDRDHDGCGRSHRRASGLALTSGHLKPLSEISARVASAEAQSLSVEVFQRGME